MGLCRSVSRVGDFLDDNEGSHEERSKAETNNDSTNDEDCWLVPLSGK